MSLWWIPCRYPMSLRTRYVWVPGDDAAPAVREVLRAATEVFR